jgi:hypothetical protein
LGATSLTSSEQTYTQWNDAEKANDKPAKAFLIAPGTHVVLKGFDTASGILLYGSA